MLSPLAGKPAPASLLINIEKTLRAYWDKKPDTSDPRQLVSFGTSGHRGTSLDSTFTQAHILAIAQAIVDYRRHAGITGPIYVGKDTHLLSDPAERTVLQVLSANGVEAIVQSFERPDDSFTPTPAISWAILTHNKNPNAPRADGIVITPSHNPPADGGIKYNPPNGGPADTDITTWIQNQANTYLKEKNKSVSHGKDSARGEYLVGKYVADLDSVIDMNAIRKVSLKIGVDPLGGASLKYWEVIRDVHKLNLTIVNNKIDPQFAFMSVDHDGKIRMDCSSPYAMASLLALKDQYEIAVANDPDSDRHGIVTPPTSTSPHGPYTNGGLMNPNHFLAVAIRYLLTHRKKWPASAAIGKTVVSSSMIDRVVASLGRTLMEVPVGFKWFAPGLFDGTVCFGGEESAGASFLRMDGSAWSTDKDGIILALLAAEITAVTGKNPGQHFNELAAQFGLPYYTRIDAPASPEQKAAFKKLTPAAVQAATLAGDPITAKLTNAPGNNAPIGGLKITTPNGWFAARPSGTENIYKIYAESFQNEKHLQQIIYEAQSIVTAALQ